MSVVATLIMILFTKTGLLMAADSASVDPHTGATQGSVSKLYSTGLRTGCAMFGNRRWLTTPPADFGDVMRSGCENLKQLGDVAVHEQLIRLSESLRMEAEKHLSPEIEQALAYQHGDVLTVVVAGFDNSEPTSLPTVEYARLSLDHNGGSLRVKVEFGNWPRRCPFLGGEAQIAASLGNRDSRLREVWGSNPAVQRVQDASDTCVTVDDADAIEFAKAAVQATLDHAAEFGLRLPRAVDWPIDTVELSHDGSKLNRIERPARSAGQQ